jgi:hypothetical protein
MVIPNELNVSVPIRIETGDLSFELTATVSVFGELIDTYVPFIELPFLARRISRPGVSEDKMKAAIKFFTEELRFAFPVLAIDCLKVIEIPDWLGYAWVVLNKKREERPEYRRYIDPYQKSLPLASGYLRMVWELRTDAQHNDLARFRLNRLLELFSIEATSRRIACRYLNSLGEGAAQLIQHRLNDPDPLAAREAQLAWERYKHKNARVDFLFD